MRAADLFEQGVIPAEIARQVGVSHQVVSDWRKAWRRDGRDGLRGAGRAGRKPKLRDEQLATVEEALANGAEANGYTTDLWTLPRVAEVIERVTGVSHPAQATSGTCCVTSWAGPGSGQPDVRSSATMRRSSSGSRNAGRS
jgi:transposase